MASQSRKHRGYATERAVADYLSKWWTGATVGRGNGKDIVNIPIDLEIKSRSQFSPLEFLRQSRKRTEKTGELSAVVCRMNGQGTTDVGGYLAFLTFSDFVSLLVKAGYTDFQSDTVNLEPTYCRCGNTIMKGSPCHICEKLDNANL
jgi:hypothetical protein